jgi:tetratricopeptide (TPR) repeat protein
MTSRSDIFKALQQGLQHQEAGRIQEAEMLYRGVLQAQPNHPDALHLLGLIAHRARHPDAIGLLGRAIQANPNNAVYHCSMAMALHEHGRSEEAILNYQRALELDAKNAEAHYNLGLLFQHLQRFAEAEHHYQKSIELNPGFAEARNNLGNIFKRTGRLNEAIAAFKAAIAHKPGLGAAHSNLGLAQLEQGELIPAAATLSKAVELSPDVAELHNNLGRLLLEQEDYENAARCFRQALGLNPQLAEASNNLGTALCHLGDVKASIEHFERAIALRPDYAEAFMNLGIVYDDEKLYGLAKKYHGEVIRLSPFSAIAQVALGIIFRKCGEPEAEIGYCRRAIELDPGLWQAHNNLAHAQLALENWEEGWKEYGWGKGNGHHPDVLRREPGYPQRVDLKGLSGKVVVLHSEQGLGDILFFMRFAPRVRELCSKLVYCGEARLAEMFQRTGLFDSVIGLQDPIPSGSLQIPVGDLPFILQCNEPENAPPPFPLSAKPEIGEAMKQLLSGFGPPPYIGLTWSAGVRPTSKHRNLLHKEVPINELAAGLKELDATFVSLQKAPQPAELDQLVSAIGRPVFDLSAANDDMEHALALVSLLDDYVGVSNTNMHLRAGVNRVAKVLVPHPPEWRWMYGTERSPWFPRVAIYRQATDGSWTDVAGKLRADLIRDHYA